MSMQFAVYTNTSQKSQNARAKWSLSMLVSKKYNVIRHNTVTVYQQLLSNLWESWLVKVVSLPLNHLNIELVNYKFTLYGDYPVW